MTKLTQEQIDDALEDMRFSIDEVPSLLCTETRETILAALKAYKPKPLAVDRQKALDDFNSRIYVGDHSFMYETLETIRATLATPASLSEQSDHSEGWQPIETAPKDGTRIIVYRPVSQNNYIRSISQDYWGDYYGGAWMKSNYFSQPTHWMPLPAPPAAPIKNVGDE